jgi:hypothetical protein
MSRKEEQEQAVLDRTTFWKDGNITVHMLWKGVFRFLLQGKPLFHCWKANQGLKMSGKLST